MPARPTQAQIEAAKREWYYKTRSGGTTDEAWSVALTAAAEVGPDVAVPEQEHILQKPGQKPDLLPGGDTAVEQTKDDWLRRESDLIAQIERGTIERCAQVLDEYFGSPDNLLSRRIRALKWS